MAFTSHIDIFLATRALYFSMVQLYIFKIEFITSALDELAQVLYLWWKNTVTSKAILYVVGSYSNKGLDACVPGGGHVVIVVGVKQSKITLFNI